MKRFVVVVDTQADFMRADGALSIAGAEMLIEPMRAWLAAFESGEVEGVLFTFDTHSAEAYSGSAEAEQFPLHCVRDTPGWANVLDPDALDPAIPVYRLEKGVFDMWAEPDRVIEAAATGGKIARDAFFDTLMTAGVRDVAVIGVAADYCVRWAIDGLVARGFAVQVPEGLSCGIARSIEQVIEADFAGKPVGLEEGI
ncbi:hypothetical protein CAF53_18965 [Sphingobium sp. LB126]|uniref:cysteine hydrolase family protein n=1 Tax=Sphingobium sp. LB126 TaxID=1983755 RepID=UPI000C1FF6B6|nr:cysteine hydrolase family protein [Sphingobium sp. LB126]PJG46278.1 hypothetical protein CAF53_18965 [Sphingobium sp. LB126]